VNKKRTDEADVDHASADTDPDALPMSAASIVVSVKLFATLRHHYPHLGIGEPMPVELPEGTTVGQLIEHLRLPAEDVKVVFVNAIVRQKEHMLRDGDELGVFPHVGGG